MFEEEFLRIALIIGGFSAGLCAFMGHFILMKKMTFIGIALSEIAALGMAVGYLAQLYPPLCSFLAVLAVIITLWVQSAKLSVPHESMIGLIYALAAAGGILVVSKCPLLESSGVDLVNGNLLFCTQADLKQIVPVGLALVLCFMMFFKEFLFTAFDRETAATCGLKSSFWDLFLLLTIGVWISVCIRITGVLFVFSSLIIPPLCVLNVFKNFRMIFFSSVLLAFAAVALGLRYSFLYDLPASPSIVTAYGVFYLGSLLLKRIRGAG